MTRRVLLLLFLLLPLLGCERAADVQAQALAPVPITADDECAVCGMSIHHHPGPKGQLFLAGSQQPAKFCSTVDLFVYALQPEYQERIAQAYVHDMSATDWQRPDDAAFIPANEAWFVVGHDQRGAMGPTLASFRDTGTAQAFIDQHGGRMLPYSAVTLEVLQELSQGGHGDHPGPGAHHHH
ncbi:MAG TPA: nitrous oxide reductase accessory protein NosL [Gammaproteobacteria bacterium]|nr:nitrous oxide reductase accessory protein NosL [Gammaproteobacteria bacterium]